MKTQHAFLRVNRSITGTVDNECDGRVRSGTSTPFLPFTPPRVQALAALNPFDPPADSHAIKLRIKRVVLLFWLDEELHRH